MNDITKESVTQAVSRICADLGVSVDVDALDQHQRGLLPKLLSYEKIDSPEISVPVIQKLMISARSFADQPIQYYDIFKAGRHVILIRALERALEYGLLSITGVDERLERLIAADDYDTFDSILFELLVGSRYQAAPEIGDVEFIREDPGSKTPDIGFMHGTQDAYAECKKFDRTTDYAAEIRNVVRGKMQPVLHTLRASNQSALVEIIFSTDPADISEKKLTEAVVESLRSNVPIIETDLTLSASVIAPTDFDDYTLYPSPKYFWERYGYSVSDDWFGIVNAMEGKPADCVGRHPSQELGQSSWLDGVQWEAAVKWRVNDENVIWKYKRLAFDLVFKGFEQLEGLGDRTHLHCWYDKEHAIGHRQDSIRKLVEQMKKNARDWFSWLIFNETIFDVSPKGCFDLIEHAHTVGGPHAYGSAPPVTVVFSSGDTVSTGPDLTGIGATLPGIDSISDS